MYDIKTIRQQLWVSMDMSYVRRFFIGLIAVGVVAWFSGTSRLSPENHGIIPLSLIIVEGPVLLFLSYRTWKIFRKSEHYIFQEAVLDRPNAAWGRGAIRFTVTVKDSRGCNQQADTHGIFATRSLLGPNLEDYVNRRVRVAYNDETGTLVVIA